MPTYEYQCQKCGFEFEEFQSIIDAPIKKCPKCKKDKVERKILGGSGLLFKGSGFYKTDYAAASSDKVSKKKPSLEPSCAGDCASCSVKH